MKDKIIIAFTYYNSPLMLQEQVRNWKQYVPKDIDIKIIVIDDGSMVYPADHELYKEVFKIPVQLYRITKDIPQNVWGARNLAFHLANIEQAKWVLILDIDHVLPSAGLDDLQSVCRKLDTSFFYHPYRYERGKEGDIQIHKHSDTFLMSPDLFWKVGGYDEDLLGYYYNSAASHFRASINRVSKGIDLESVFTIFYPSSFISDASPLEKEEKTTFKGSYKKNKKPNVLNFDWDRIL
jgi:hypothetical protein